MVRLKVILAKEGINNDNEISIPYGAIKRGIDRILWNTKIEFQFLMVRLKEYKLINREVIKNRFQFLMVRLKGCIKLLKRL